MDSDIMAVDTPRQGKLGTWLALGLRVAGAVLLAVSAGIHLDLYLTGYRSIPTIGWLFLLQVIVGFVLAAAVLATRSRLAAAAAAGVRAVHARRLPAVGVDRPRIYQLKPAVEQSEP